MPRPLDTRLDRVEGQRIAAAAEHSVAAIRPALRAEAAMGAVIRSALARAGVDAADATRLANADDSPRADDFESKILVMARGYAGGQRPDFANASFAELFAWSLADERLGRDVFATGFQKFARTRGGIARPA